MTTKKYENPLMPLLYDGLHDMYSCEKLLVKFTKELAAAALTKELKSGIALSPTDNPSMHIERLQLIFKILNLKHVKQDCKISKAIIENAYDVIKIKKSVTATRDVSIVLAAQMIQHYKIACYQYLYSLSTELDLKEVSMLLEQCLADEKNTSGYLTQIAQNIINPLAKKKVFH